MQKELNKIAKDTNIFLKKFIKKQKKSELIIPMQYGLFSGGKKIEIERLPGWAAHQESSKLKYVQ